MPTLSRWGRIKERWRRPKLSVWLVHTSLIRMDIGFLFGAWFAVHVVVLVGHLIALSAVLLFAALIYPRVKPIRIYPASSNS